MQEITRIIAFILEKYNWVIIAAGTVAIYMHILNRRNRNNTFSLYILTIKNLESQKNYTIGFYPTEAIAKEIAERYNMEVPGFKDNPCESYIDKVKVYTYKGRYDESICVYTGWNEDDNGVKDIWVQYYFTRPEYSNELSKFVLSKVPRDQWTMNIYKVGESYWEEGFEEESTEEEESIEEEGDK